MQCMGEHWLHAPHLPFLCFAQKLFPSTCCRKRSSNASAVSMLMTKSEITVGDTGFGELVTFSLYSYIQNNKKSIFVQYLFLAGPAPYPQSLADGLLTRRVAFGLQILSSRIGFNYYLYYLFTVLVEPTICCFSQGGTVVSTW